MSSAQYPGFQVAKLMVGVPSHGENLLVLVGIAGPIVGVASPTDKIRNSCNHIWIRMGIIRPLPRSHADQRPLNRSSFRWGWWGWMPFCRAVITYYEAARFRGRRRPSVSNTLWSHRPKQFVQFLMTTQACDRCHRRKTRCDKVRPECGPCSRASSSCVYSERLKEPLVRRDVVNKLERRLNQLEAANRSLRARLASSREEVVTDQRQSALSPSSTAPTPAESPEEQHRGPDDDVANEVSFLSTSAGGDRQFLGSASGLLFASLVRASVVARQNDRTAPSCSLPEDRSPGGSAGRLEWGIDDRELPPRQLAQSLVEAYLAHDHLCFPFLGLGCTRAMVNSIYADTAYCGSHPFESFVFNMLLAIATSQIHKFNWQVLPDAETHHLRAMSYLNAVLYEGGLKALQSMLLLCQFRLGSSSKDAYGSKSSPVRIHSDCINHPELTKFPGLWHIVGIAVRMCFELGLHRESTYKLTSVPGNPSSAFSKSFEEQEVRRRCFWATFALDRYVQQGPILMCQRITTHRVVSITLGRPLAMCLEDIDVALPALDVHGVNNTPSATSPGDEDEVTAMSPSRTAIFVHIVRYRRLCGKLLTSLHRESRSTVQPESDLRRIKNELSVELEAWRSDTSSLNLPEMDLTTPIVEARSSFRSKAWYELLYHNGVLLLYRPSSATAATLADAGDLQRMFTSARQSITLYSYLFCSRKINCSWITLHACFMAGLSYVYIVSRHIREKRRQQVSAAQPPKPTLEQDPTIMELVNDFRACSNVLVAVSERCNAQKSCHEVFDRLSDAILADAVALLSTSATAKRREQSDGHAPAPLVHNSAHSLKIPQVLNATSSPASPPNFQLPADPQYTSHAGIPVEQGAFAHDHVVDQNFNVEPVLATDNALRDCFPDLQRMYDTQWGDDAIIQLGIDWLAEIYPGNGMTMAEAMDTSFL